MKPLPLAGPGMGSTISPPPPHPMACRVCEMVVNHQEDGLCAGCRLMLREVLG